MKDLDCVLAGLASVWPTCSPGPAAVFTSVVSAAIADTCCSPAVLCPHLHRRTLHKTSDLSSVSVWMQGPEGRGWYMIYRVWLTLIQYLRRRSLLYSQSGLFEFYTAFITSCALHTAYNSYFLYYICPVKRIITIILTKKIAWLQINSIQTVYLLFIFKDTSLVFSCRETESAKTQISLWISEPNLILSNCRLCYTWRKLNNTPSGFSL